MSKRVPRHVRRACATSFTLAQPIWHTPGAGIRRYG